MEFYMKNFHSTLFFVVLLSVSTSYSMDMRTFKKGAWVRVVRGSERLRNRVMEIQGTSQEVWGIKDIWGSSDALGYPAIVNYMTTDNGPDDYGAENVYYVKDKYRIGYCVHHSWLKKEENFDEGDLPAIITGTLENKKEKKHRVTCTDILWRCLGRR